MQKLKPEIGKLYIPKCMYTRYKDNVRAQLLSKFYYDVDLLSEGTTLIQVFKSNIPITEIPILLLVSIISIGAFDSFSFLYENKKIFSLVERDQHFDTYFKEAQLSKLKS